MTFKIQKDFPEEHIRPRCLNCRAILADFWVVEPMDIEWQVQCKCPWCRENGLEDERSGVETVRGRFAHGGAALPRPDDETDDIPSTRVEGFEDEDGVFVFEVKKANDHAKPIR